jgi:hypothetical protein
LAGCEGETSNTAHAEIVPTRNIGPILLKQSLTPVAASPEADSQEVVFSGEKSSTRVI